MAVQTVLGGRAPNSAPWPGSQHHATARPSRRGCLVSENTIVGRIRSPVTFRAKGKSDWLTLGSPPAERWLWLTEFIHLFDNLTEMGLTYPTIPPVKCTVQWLFVESQSPQLAFDPPREPLHPLAITLLSPPSPAQLLNCLLCPWICWLCPFPGGRLLRSFVSGPATQQSAGFVHVIARISVSFLLWPRGTLWYEQTTLCFSVLRLTDVQGRFHLGLL